MTYLTQTRRISVRSPLVTPKYRSLNVNLGKHWTAEQVANTFAPHPEASDTTLAWLRDSGIDVKRIKHSVGKSGPSCIYNFRIPDQKIRTQLGRVLGYGCRARSTVEHRVSLLSAQGVWWISHCVRRIRTSATCSQSCRFRDAHHSVRWLAPRSTSKSND